MPQGSSSAFAQKTLAPASLREAARRLESLVEEFGAGLPADDVAPARTAPAGGPAGPTDTEDLAGMLLDENFLQSLVAGSPAPTGVSATLPVSVTKLHEEKAGANAAGGATMADVSPIAGPHAAGAPVNRSSADTGPDPAVSSARVTVPRAAVVVATPARESAGSPPATISVTVAPPRSVKPLAAPPHTNPERRGPTEAAPERERSVSRDTAARSATGRVDKGQSPVAEVRDPQGTAGRGTIDNGWAFESSGARGRTTRGARHGEVEPPPFLVEPPIPLHGAEWRSRRETRGARKLLISAYEALVARSSRR